MASASDEKKETNPLLAALPPATDSITYLTIVEYNLTEQNLPVLHSVLQDRDLTQNIGWDLINLLLPLLPASEECLEVIAAKGNPRECILKVTEALRLLEFEQPYHDSDEEDDAPVAEGSTRTAPVAVGESSASPAVPTPAIPPIHVLKFEVLLTLLSTLHRRLKTKYPSRFLSTSLQAVLTAYNRARTHQDELTLSAVKFVKTMSGTKRPHLPPRVSSGNLLRANTEASEPDPEAQQDPPTADESTLANRLLQSFITHVLEDYILSLSSEEDVPGLAWSARLMENFEPQRIVPHKKTFVDRFANEEGLKARSAIIGQVVALAQDLSITTDELVKTINDPEAEGQGIPGSEDEPPSSAADIPLSKTGALFLFAARSVRQEIYSSAELPELSNFHIFPEHATLLENFVGTLGQQTVGLEPEALLDTVIALGLFAIEKNNVGVPADDDAFTKYLQTTSLISANTPSPTLRYHAHFLTSTILRSHPSDVVRLSFIRDTLEHCPYENLKATAVGWLKGEVIEANAPHLHSHDHDGEDEEHKQDTVFSTPVALQSCAPFLFPDLSQSFHTSVEISESWMQYRSELSLIVTTLNFYYLLLTAKFLHDAVDIKGLHKQANVEKGYLQPLKEASTRFKKALEDGGELAIAEGGGVVMGDVGDGVGQAKGDLSQVDDAVEKVEKGIRALGL